MNMLLKLRFIAVGSAFFLFVTCLCAGQQAKSQAPPEKPQTDNKAAQSKLKITVTDATPEEALRTFMLALLAQNETALRAVTVPDPDLSWLLKSEPLPPDVIKDASAQIAKQPIKRLKAGETITLARGRKVVVAPDEVGDEKAILLPQGAPIPTRLQRLKGRWKVDASPFIAGRKAADAARKKAEAKSAGPKKVAPINP
jgi:hypothetical protein